MWLIIPIVLLMGTVFGAVQGALIHYFRLQAFIVTLAGMFFARGLCFLITTQSITITDPTFKAISAFRLSVGVGSVSANVLIAAVTLAAAIYVAHFTRFGRNVYAVGGNPRSALLMGLPVARTRVGVYALSGFCSALGGAVFTFYVLSGYGLQGQGMRGSSRKRLRVVRSCSGCSISPGRISRRFEPRASVSTFRSWDWPALPPMSPRNSRSRLSKASWCWEPFTLRPQSRRRLPAESTSRARPTPSTPVIGQM